MAVKNITMSVLTRLKQQAKMEELISRSTRISILWYTDYQKKI